MNEKAFREILIFVTGTTPQIVTEMLYVLTQDSIPPVVPDEIHIITTLSGKQKVVAELLTGGRLGAFSKEFDLRAIPLSEASIHVVEGDDGKPLDDIQDHSHNEALGNCIADFIREKAQDMGTRLHCSLAGGRKTMSFYLGSALQLFGRPWDKLYHVLVSPEFESHPDFYYKPRKNRLLELKDPGGKVVRKLNTKDALITLAELPFIRLRDKIPLDGKGFKELVSEGQREIDTASVQPTLRVNLQDRVIYVGQDAIDMVPVQMVLYVYFLGRKSEDCSCPERPYCLECTECFPAIGDLSKRRAFDEMVRDYRRVYGTTSGRVEEFIKHWGEKGAVDSDTLRQNISKINTTVKEHLKDETLHPYFTISAIGKHGSKRYGIRAEKRKIVIE